MFEENQFGKTPNRKNISFNVFDKGTLAYDGKALRKQVTIYFTKDTSNYRADLLIYVPAESKKPVPLFFNISFFPNNMVVKDPEVKRGMMWNRERKTGSRSG